MANNGYVDNQSPDVLIGWRAIGTYLAVCETAARRFERLHMLPVARLPDGRVVTTKNLIEQWLMARCKVHRQAKGWDVDLPESDITPEAGE